MNQSFRLFFRSTIFLVSWTAFVLSSFVFSSLAVAELPAVPDGAFNFVVMPDTQTYTYSQPEIFHAETQWIVDNLQSQQIKFVSHVGDIVETYSVIPQWEVAQAAMDRLHGQVPYGVVVGNHDMTAAGDTSMFQQYFPESRFDGFDWYGGSFINNTASYQLFSASGNDYVVVHLPCNAPDNYLTWADGVMNEHAGRTAIVSTHMYLGPTLHPTNNDEYFTAPRGRMEWKKCFGVAGNTPEQMWQKSFQNHENLSLIVCGDQSRPQTMHRTVRGLNGNTVHEVLSDYRDGYMRLYTFLPDDETIEVTTYSPYLDQICTGTTYAPDPADHVFTLQKLPALPLLSSVLVANIDVQGDSSSVTAVVSQSSGSRVSLTNTAKGSYEPAIDGAALMPANGVLMATARANEVFYPPVDGMRYPTVEVGRDGPFASTAMALATTKKGAGSPERIAANTSMAWFPFADGWIAAHVNADGTVLAGGGVDNSMITYHEVSKDTYGPAPAYDIAIPGATQDTGMLFVVASSTTATTAEQVHVASTMALPGGEWRVSILHNDTSTYPDQTHQSEFSFVYVPLATKGLVAGYIKAEDGSVLEGQTVGDYTIERTGYGTFELTIDGATPDDGVLLLGALDHHPTTNMPQDDWVTYAPSQDGQKFVIWTRDLNGIASSNSLTPTDFVFAFIPMTVAADPLPGDANNDGKVDAADATILAANWQTLATATWGQGDFNKDGKVDDRDATILAANWQVGVTDASASVPEPSTLVGLLVIALAGTATSQRIAKAP